MNVRWVVWSIIILVILFSVVNATEPYENETSSVELNGETDILGESGSPDLSPDVSCDSLIQSIPYEVDVSADDFSVGAIAPGWGVEKVATADDVGMDTSLALDSSGNPHISYYDRTNGYLKYARKTGSSWAISTVGSAGQVEGYTSLALDSSGYPHISYYDSTNADLKYAQWTGGLLWSTTTVDTAGDVGFFPSLALDSSGNPHISYYNGTNDDLKYARKTGSSWDISTVDSVGDVGRYTSLALDTYGNPHISYYDHTNWDVKYAQGIGSSWAISTVDTDDHVGWCTSLALDSSGNPHISYHDVDNGDLKYARKTGSSWAISTVDTAGIVGWDTSLALDSSGNPHISYFDDDNGDLKYARWTGSSWNISTVDSVGRVGRDTSLALDSSGNPHISYVDSTNMDLKYARWKGIQPDRIGVFRPSTRTFYLDWNGNGRWDGGVTDRAFCFGLTGDIPVSGDWNSLGKTCIGVFRPSTHTFYLDWNGNGRWDGGVTDRAFSFGLTDDIPMTGDWNSLGKTCIGVFRPSTHTFYMDWNGNGRWDGGVTDRQNNFGLTDDIPMTGDWNSLGKTCIGVFRPSTHRFYLDWSGNGRWDGGVTDRQYNFGLTGDIPVTGDWDALGRTSIGVFRPSTRTFYLDWNGNGRWDGPATDQQYTFGLVGDAPITGKW